MELLAERQRDLLGAVPRGDEHRALVGQQRQGRAEDVGVAGRLDDQRHVAVRGAGQLVGCRPRDRRRAGEASSPPRPRLHRDHVGSGPLQHEGGSAPTTPRPNTRTVSPSDGPASRVICRAVSTSGNSVAWRGATSTEGDNTTGVDEAVLMRVEGEHQGAFGELGAALLDDPDAAVAVAERVAERPAEDTDRLVERKIGIELTAKGEQLGPGADAREQRADEDLTGGRAGEAPRA